MSAYIEFATETENGEVTHQPTWRGHFEKMELSENCDSTLNRGYAIFHEPNSDTIVGAALKDGGLNIRWGTSPNKLNDWHKYLVYTVDVKHLPEGSSYSTIHFCDYSSLMRVNGGFRTFPDKTSKQIAEKFSELYQVPIEAEDTDGESSAMQNGESDWEFLQSFKNYAISKSSNRGDFRLYFRNGKTLLFRPPDYTQQPVHEFNVFGGRGYVEDFEVRSTPLQTASDFGESARSFGHLRDDIQPFASVFDRDKDKEKPKPGLNQRQLDDRTKRISLSGGFRGQYRFTPADSASFSDKMSKSEYDQAVNRSNTAILKTLDQPKINLGEIINVKLSRHNKQEAIGHGMWFVEGTQRIFSKNSETLLRVNLSSPMLNKGTDEMDNVVNPDPKVKSNPTQSKTATPL